jgi:hypothetical protein
MARQLLGSIEGGISDVVPSGNKKRARLNLIKHLGEQALCRSVPRCHGACSESLARRQP